MYVSGTEMDNWDWFQNAAEGFEHLGLGPDGGGVDLGFSSKHRHDYAEYLDEKCAEYDVKIVYGHSRGAAILSDMKYEATYIGLDGATFIGDHKEMINLQNAVGFDKGLGLGHKGNIPIPGTAFHKAWKDTKKKEKKRKQDPGYKEPEIYERKYISPSSRRKEKKQKTGEKAKQDTKKTPDKPKNPKPWKSETPRGKGKGEKNYPKKDEWIPGGTWSREVPNDPVPFWSPPATPMRKRNNFDRDFGMYYTMNAKDQKVFENNFATVLSKKQGAKYNFKSAKKIYAKSQSYKIGNEARDAFLADLDASFL